MAEIGNDITPDGDFATEEYPWATQLLTMPEAGTFTSIRVFGMDTSGSSTGQVVVKIFDSTGNTLATSSATGGFAVTPGSNVNVSISYAASASQQIRLGVIGNAGIRIGQLDSPGVSRKFAFDGGGVVFPAYPSDPISWNYSEEQTVGLLGIYTPSGGGSTPRLLLLGVG